MNSKHNLNREELILKLSQVAAHLQKESMSRREFVRATGINQSNIFKHFDSWNDFVQAAGLQPIDKSRIDDDKLFPAMRDAFIAAGCITTQRVFQHQKICRYSIDVFSKRWGRWNNVLLEFRRWVEKNDPDFPYLSDLPTASPRQPTGQSELSAPYVPNERISNTVWGPKGGRQYGQVINFRGLQHAPINEQGVVFLFGMIAQELGYLVESVATGFPDCEAKRRISKSSDTWERVRIEFEFKSRNFLAHGHNPELCDVIVCWEHDWSDCPIEVLELKREIASLKG